MTEKIAASVKTHVGAIVAIVTLITMMVGGIIWIYTVRADTTRALDGIASLESRMNDQAKASQELKIALIKLTVSVDNLTRVYERGRRER